MAAGVAHEPPEPKVLEDFMKKPGGPLVLLLMAVGAAPLMEEFAFRGWIQRPLERRLGPAWAIGITAALFALAHFQPDGIPVRLVGGIALGWAVWATGSIRAGVALHVAWNVGVLALGGAFHGFDPAGRGAALAVPAALVFVAAAAAFAVGARRLRDESRVTRGARARRGRSPPRPAEGATGCWRGRRRGACRTRRAARPPSEGACGRWRHIRAPACRASRPRQRPSGRGRGRG
jgi:hypothetical protein